MVAGGVGPRAATARPASTQWGDGEMSKGDFNGFNMDLARVNQLSQKMKLTRRKPNQNCGYICESNELLKCKVWGFHWLGSVRDLRSPPPSPVGASGHGARQPVALRGLGSSAAQIKKQSNQHHPGQSNPFPSQTWSKRALEFKRKFPEIRNVENLLGTEICP